MRTACVWQDTSLEGRQWICEIFEMQNGEERSVYVEGRYWTEEAANVAARSLSRWWPGAD